MRIFAVFGRFAAKKKARRNGPFFLGKGMENPFSRYQEW
jgi:hypothetical protein